MTPSDPTTLDLAEALDDLAAPAYVIDREGRFGWVNRAFEEIFGDLRGQRFVETVVPEHRDLARTNFARKVVGKTTSVFDLTVLDRHGDRVTFRITSAPLREEDGVVGIFGIGVPLPQAAVRSPSALDDLTPRQLEVLRLLLEGLQTPEIAKRLGVADETARNHIRALLRATGAHSRLEVVLLGLKHGLDAPHLTQPGHQPETLPADE